MSEYTGGYGGTSLDYTRLIGAVDGVPESRNMGVVVIANGSYSVVRAKSVLSLGGSHDPLEYLRYAVCRRPCTCVSIEYPSKR